MHQGEGKTDADAATTPVAVYVVAEPADKAAPVTLTATPAEGGAAATSVVVDGADRHLLGVFPAHSAMSVAATGGGCKLYTLYLTTEEQERAPADRKVRARDGSASEGGGEGASMAEAEGGGEGGGGGGGEDGGGNDDGCCTVQ